MTGVNMDWLKDFRGIIHGESPRLLAAGLSFLGEDDNSVKFIDHQVAFTFSVEPFSDSLAVLVKFLSDEHPDEEIYALHIIMALTDPASTTRWFEVKAPQDRVRIVRSYVDFIVQHKESLFGEVFPLALQYKRTREDAARRIAAMFAQHAPTSSKP
jgi:hypothetical protein